MSGHGGIRLVLSDVDGTLLTHDKVLTDRAIKAVQKLHERGIHFTLTSSRPPEGLKMLLQPLRISDPFAGFNGGLIVRPDFSVVRTLPIEESLVEGILDVLLRNEVSIWIFQGQDWFVSDRDGPHVMHESSVVGMKPSVPEEIGTIHGNIVKIVGVSDDRERMLHAEKEMQTLYGASASVSLSQPYYLDITHRDANKGGVVRAMEQMLGIPAQSIATLGDQFNDVSMFCESGLSIAMGQASDEVKARATFVTTDCDDEGFARAIERYILGESDGRA